MKLVGRQNIHHLKTDADQDMPRVLCCSTYEVMKYGRKFVHFFTSTEPEVRMLSTACSYKVHWETNGKTYIRFYTLVGRKLEYLSTNTDKFARYIGDQGVFRTTAKVIVVATTDRVKVRLTFQPINHAPIPLLPQIESKYSKGHETYVLTEDYWKRCQTIKDYSTRHALFRELYKYNAVPRPREYASKLVYYLHMDSIVTISTKLASEDRRDPFSVQLKCGINLVAMLDYDIEICPSAGEDAEITVTVIETISLDSYVKVKDLQDHVLKRTHTGRQIRGQFELPLGLTDVGLHIYTPYGYGDDSRKDKYTDLATFKKYSITYKLN